MSVGSDPLTIERTRDVWTVRFEPTELMVFAHPVATNALFELLAEVKSRRVKILRTDYARGCLAPAAIDRFWQEVRRAPAVAGGRREPPAPAVARHAASTITRLLKQLRGVRTLAMSSFQGEVDLDLFGVLLTAHYRVCSEDTVIVNRVLDRDTVPGSALYWMLTRYVGLAAANDLLLDRTSLTAQEALELRLVNRVVAPDDLESEADAVAQRFASKPTRALASLARASTWLDTDLATYLDRVGPGFTL